MFVYAIGQRYSLSLITTPQMKLTETALYTMYFRGLVVLIILKLLFWVFSSSQFRNYFLLSQ